MTHDDLLAGFDNLLIEISEKLRAGLPGSLDLQQRKAIETHIVNTVGAARDGVDDIR